MPKGGKRIGAGRKPPKYPKKRYTFYLDEKLAAIIKRWLAKKRRQQSDKQ